MGLYNPHSPQILGQEWVPIRDEDFFLSPAVNEVEQGHVFTASADRTLVDGRFYLNTFPSANTLYETIQISVYPNGTEDQTGPVHSVLIPCNNGGISGNSFLVGGATVAACLSNPSDGQNVQLSGGTPNDANVDLYFNTNAYAALLNGKRILSVEALYVAQSGNFEENSFDGRAGIYQVPSATGVDYAFTAFVGGAGRNEIVAPEAGTGKPVYNSFPLGEVTPFWSTTPLAQNEWLPWTYTTLQRFEFSAVSRITLRFYTTDNAVGVLVLDYVALRVTYCEEKRIAVASQSFSYPSSTVAYQRTYTLGANAMPMRVPGSNALLPVIPAGANLVVVSAPDTGLTDRKPYPLLNGIRELYEIPSTPGVQVLVSKTEGETFTSVSTHILPQISLHTSGGPLTEVHAYGRQASAQVYGTITATQDIYDSISGVNHSYPWVRYYARRFGDTTIPLTLTGVQAAFLASTVSITPAEFDALDEIIDGWKEVTLRFATPPSMGAFAGDPSWKWTATAETSGNRWEILAACAPAVSGIPGNNYNYVPAPHQLSTATYEPPSGATVELTWMPQGIGSIPVSGSSADVTTDAVLIFAQDMPTVTGFGAAITSQEVTGIGQDCGLDPCCIPTAIQYVQLTWVATSTSIPASGFGYYEMQRMDTIDTEWLTIMKATSVTGASFKDYEARVGILSSYRIRAVDVYDFPGPWSATVTATIPEPGVTIGCDDGHLLIFTTNERQDGSSNLAYSSVWENRVEEGFDFAEAGFVQLQAMYDRDFFTAFRPTERGGEQFQRTVLVQAAAISPPTLGDFTSLRDMAWEPVSYICVRDEDGNRWLATVLVPSGRVTLNRRLYMAPVSIVEVTATPSPADPFA